MDVDESSHSCRKRLEDSKYRPPFGNFDGDNLVIWGRVGVVVLFQLYRLINSQVPVFAISNNSLSEKSTCIHVVDVGIDKVGISRCGVISGSKAEIKTMQIKILAQYLIMVKYLEMVKTCLVCRYI